MIPILDNASLKAGDALVMHLWNEHGVSYKQVHRATSAVYMVTAAACFSDEATNFGPRFWTLMAATAAAITFGEWHSATLPDDLQAKLNWLSRQMLLARLWRAGMWLFIAMSAASAIISGKGWDATFYNVAWLAGLVMWSAVLPPKPRNKKRKEAKAGQLALAHIKE